MATNTFSSSPAFGTPAHPFLPTEQRPLAAPAFKPAIASILPILLPPATLRPIAFRTFTKRHNLTLGSSALQVLASFVGRHCGSAWRDEGTGEKVLEEVARMWKAENGPAIVEDGSVLSTILKTLDGCMTGGRIGASKKSGSGVRRQSSFTFGNDSAIDLARSPSIPSLSRNASSGLSMMEDLDMQDPDDDDGGSKDPRSWLKVVSAFDQPRFVYDLDKKQFLPNTTKPNPFPSPTRKTEMFRDRLNIIHQRLQRHPAFQAPSLGANVTRTLRRQDSSVTDQQFYKITPIANLLGRGGTSHVLLGMLVIAPTGTLALNDSTGSINLDLQHATSMQGGEIEPYFCPGMIVLVEGLYAEDWTGAGSSGLGNTGGVGGTISGKFNGFQIGTPPVEKRDISLGINLNAGEFGGGFGYIDFLGLGSERAVGSRMKRIERSLVGPSTESDDTGRKLLIMSQVTLDQPSTLAAVRKVLEDCAAQPQPPLAIILMGSFSSKAVMAGASTGSIEYKELFNDLALVLADFPSLLRNTTWIFLPGDNDPWASSFSAGASPLLPRSPIPDLFTSRIRRAFASAKSDSANPPLPFPSKTPSSPAPEAIWTSNPARLSLFGPAHEVVLFRDDIDGRLRRNSVRIGQAAKREAREAQRAAAPDLPPTSLPSTPFPTLSAKRLILSLLPQSTLSPFLPSLRPTHWDYHPSALGLYPLPHTLILADAELAPFALTFEGCHVLNPGRLVEGSAKRKKVQWVEYDVWSKRGGVRELWIG